VTAHTIVGVSGVAKGRAGGRSPLAAFIGAALWAILLAINLYRIY